VTLRGERGFIYGWWYLGWRGAGIVVSSEWDWGFEETYYDGPIYMFSIGWIHLSYVP
jgi:hypothetical protein